MLLCLEKELEALKARLGAEAPRVGSGAGNALRTVVGTEPRREHLLLAAGKLEGRNDRRYTGFVRARF